MDAVGQNIDDYNRYLIATLERGDAEKRLIIERVDAICVDQGAVSELRNSLRERDSTIFLLQVELSDLRLALQEEREKTARLMNENAVLLAQGEDDRVKISNLVRMRRSEFAVDAAQASAPYRVAVQRSTNKDLTRTSGDSSMSLRSVVTGYPRTAKEVSTAGSKDVADAVQPPPASTVVTALAKEVDLLKRQLDEQRGAYEKDRAVRVSQERERFQQQQDTIHKYATTIQQLQEVHSEATKELVTYRHEQQIIERRLRGDMDQLRSSLSDVRHQLTQSHARQSADLQLALQSADTRHHDVVSKLRSDLLERKEALASDRELADRRITVLENDLRKSQTALAAERRSKHRLIEHHRFETEGLQTEINLMKQHLRAVEKRAFFASCRGLSEPPLQQ